MLEPLPILELLREYGLKPKKSLGQNFLVEEHTLRKIVEAAGVSQSDTVLEIGAGVGSLTRHLAYQGAAVTAVEIDANLMPLLQYVMKDFPSARLVLGDIMAMDLKEMGIKPGYKVVANIPYYLTSNLIRQLLEAPAKPSLLALTIQKEVAERITALKGEMSLLSLSVQLYGQPRIALEIPASAFHPVPKVDSAVLIVDLLENPRIPAAQQKVFFALAKTAFRQKRKMLHNSLAGAPGVGKERVADLLEKGGIGGNRRPQTLTLEEWGRLSQAFISMADQACF